MSTSQGKHTTRRRPSAGEHGEYNEQEDGGGEAEQSEGRESPKEVESRRKE